MPILALNGPEAIRIRKANRLASWENRAQENRIEPIAKPAFDTPFRLEQGEKIFTIGSCFARHVEGELIARGFEIPMRDLFRTPAFEGLEHAIVNNFGTPSIYNELAWAFGEETFDEQVDIVEVGTGRFVDLHMVNSLRPAPLEQVLARRSGLMKAVRSLAECRVLIMTLGLVEIWWDGKSHRYLNTAPLPAIMKTDPLRYSLHVLGFDECHDYLKRALNIAFRHGRDDLHVILTVSPVPLMATHRQMDVITANSYSKSLLRSVAEHIVAANDRISYFPSYESVTLSDRRIAWMDDMVHVTPEIVGINVDRMVDAFTGNPSPVERQLPAMQQLPTENAVSLLLADRARRARALEDGAFFETHGNAARSSPAFALEYAKYLYDQRDFDRALAIMTGDGPEAELLRAKILFRKGEYEQASVAAKKICATDPKGQAKWQLRLNIAITRDSLAEIEAIEQEWLAAQPARREQILTTVSSAYRRAGDMHRALDRLRKSGVEPAEAQGLAPIEWAWALLRMREFDQVQQIVENHMPRSDWQVNQICQIGRKLRAMKEKHAAKNNQRPKNDQKRWLTVVKRAATAIRKKSRPQNQAGKTGRRARQESNLRPQD